MSARFVKHAPYLTKNLMVAGGCGIFVTSVYAYTINQMVKQDDFADLEDVKVVNAHKSGIKVSKRPTPTKD